MGHGPIITELTGYSQLLSAFPVSLNAATSPESTVPSHPEELLVLPSTCQPVPQLEPPPSSLICFFPTKTHAQKVTASSV